MTNTESTIYFSRTNAYCDVVYFSDAKNNRIPIHGTGINSYGMPTQLLALLRYF